MLVEESLMKTALGRGLAVLTLALTCSCGSGGSTSLPSVEAPTVSPAAPLNFGAPVTVTLATATAAAVIHCTVDGTPPTIDSPACDTPLTLTGTTTVRALATHAGMAASPTVSSTFTHRPITLAADTGTWSPYAYTSVADQYLVANRLTPLPGDYPFLLRSVQIAFFPQHAGTAIRLAVYADADADWANGATLLTTLDTTVLNNGDALATATWSVYELPAPIRVTGPGDLLVGFVVLPPLTTFDWPLDPNGSGRTMMAYWTTTVPNPPFLPSYDFFAQPSTALIRASN